jgi:hypothetical protein
LITSTIDFFEIVWTLAAIPGLWFWIGNRLEAGLDAKAAASIVPRNGRFLWARFSVFLTNTFIGIEVLFVLLGITAMTRPVAPVADGTTNFYRLVLVIGLISASCVITMLAYRWRQVNAEIVSAARRKHAHDELPPTDDRFPDEFDDALYCDTGGHRLQDCPRGR